MVLKVYSIHDAAVKVFLTPHFARTHGEAERNFKSAVNDSKNGHLYNHPEQFTLFCLGEYDDETGILTSLTTPHAVITAVQCKETSNISSIGA